MRKKFLLTMFSLVLFAFCGTSLHAQYVAKVGDKEYATIDEAIANWSNNTTLTLLTNVTLSDVIQLSSTEYHILDLGTYTMTAASSSTKIPFLGTYTTYYDAIQIVNNGRSSASYALDIKADANNPGGITAKSKTIVKTTGKDGVQDRPIIRFYGGVFNASNIVSHSGSNGTNCPQFWFYGGEFNGTISANRAKFCFYGGTFNGSLSISVDSSADALVSGGKFKLLSNSYGSTLNTDKFTIGSSFGVYDRSIYVDAEGYYVVTSEVITEVSAKYPAVKKESYNSNNYFYYSAANAYGMFYEVASMAGTGDNVTIWEKPAVTIPETLTGAVVEEIKNNTALKDYTPENLPAGAELEIELNSVGETFVYDVTPMVNGEKVEPTEAIKFRLPVPASVTKTYAKVYHEGTSIGIYAIQGEGNAKYVEIASADFSEFAVEPITHYEVATYQDLIAALANDGAFVIMTADITATATQSSGYGKAGIVVDAGDVLDGNDKILTINGAGATWDCAIAMRGGEVKNLTISGAMRGVFMPGANGDVVIDNCEFKNVVYTFNSDAGSKNYTVTIKNTTLNGWTSFSNAHKSVTFETCTFGEGSGYAFCRPYQATTFVDCEFNEGYEFDTKSTTEVLAFNDCTYNEQSLSAENNAMFYNGGEVVINGTATDVNHYVATIDTQKYLTLEAAFTAATEGQTITLLADATPALTSQRAITKAAVIDLGGKTLTLTEDDLYFGTTTFKNGTIVVDPSVKPSAAVFWMFANQTLTFDAVKVVATGVTGTYLIGLDGNNSDLNLINGSEILVENTTALDLDIICVNASTGNDIKVENSKVNVKNLDGRVFFRGNYTVSGNSEVNLEGITKAGFRIEAGQTLSIEGTSKVNIVGEPRDGGIHLTDLTATYTKAEEATVNATLNRPYAAQIGENKYITFDEAAAAAQAGSEIKLLANIEGDITVPANVTLNGNGFAVSGAITAAGEITFAGVTKTGNFGVKNTNTVVNIPAGASLQLTGTGRMVIGHGCTFNINGTIADAKNANVADVTPSLVMPGASFTGAGVTFNVTNAYISAPSSYCSSSKSASGTFDFNITNSIWENAGKLAFESQSTAATVNFDLKNSVLNTGSHLVFGVSRGEIVVDNSNVNVGKSNQIENQSTMTIKNGSVVNGSVATSSNAKNPGTVIVENATYAVTGEFSGSDLGTGTLIIKKGATVSAGSITKANITIDAEGMTASDAINLTANLSKLAGELSVINNDKLEAKIVDGKVVLAAKPVAKIGDTPYTSLEDAFKAATSGCTIDILLDVTVDYAWDARYTGGKFTVPVTINGNGKTIKFTASVNDQNYQAPFRFEADATVKDLTIDMSETTDSRFRAISSKGNLTVDGCTFIGKDATLNCRAIIFGEGAGANVGNLAISVTNSKFINWKRGITDNENAQDVKTATITGNTLENAAVYVSAYENVTFTGNTVEGAYVDIRSYTANSSLNVTATGNTLEENTDTAYNYIKATGNIDQEGFKVYAVAKIGDVEYTTIEKAYAALQEGDEIVILKKGSYALKVKNNVTITGAVNGVEFANIGAFGCNGANVTFNNVTFTYANNSTYKGLQHSGNLVYNNCTFNGQVFLYGASETFNNCTFNTTDSNNYNVWTYGAKEVAFNECTFNCAGKSVLIYNESASVNNNVAVTNSQFIASQAVEGKAAIEMDSSLQGTINLTIYGETTATGFAAGNVSGNSLWNNKKANNDITVVVDNETVLAPIDGDGTDAKPYLINNVRDLIAFRESVNAGKTEFNAPGVWVALNADLDLAGTTWNHGIGDGINATFDGIFDGRNNTIKNFTMEVSAPAGDYVCGGLFGYIYGAATIKNLKIENPTIKATISGEGQGHNVGVLVGFANNNGGKATIDNVTVKGNVKVDAPNVYGVGAIVGYSYRDMGTISNCTVDANDDSYIKGYSFVGGITGYSYSNAVISNCSVENLAITATSYSVGGIAGVVNNNNKIENCRVAETVTVNGQANVGSVVGAIGGEGSTLTIENCTAAEPMIGGNYGNNKAVVAKIGEKYYTLEGAVAAVKEGETITILAGTHSEGTIKLPATLKNVTFKGVEGTVLKDMTISAADGNSYSYVGLTFDGITFDNSRLLFTGWRNGEEVIENLTVTNCIFKNISDNTNTAPVHINKDATEAVKGFTFTNNVIDGATGGSKSGIYAQVTGNVVVENNIINNVSFRPYVIQITTDDGIADNFTVKGNTFSGSAAGRAQGLGNKAEGTDDVTLVVSNNIFKNITNSQQICYWNFNAEKTTADLSGNYYDIDIVANPGKIYYNAAAANIGDLVTMDIFPIYTALNEDGTIDLNSAFTVNGVSTKAELNAAIASAEEGAIIVMIADIDYGTDQLAIAKAITLDLGGNTLTTRNSYGGMSVKGNPTIKNGTIVHASNTAAIKVWNATAFEDLVIDVQGKGDANKTIGGIVLQSGSTTRVGSIKNVTIKGAALTNGIETYNCGDATENVIGAMDNVAINAQGTGMLISAPCGTATNCSISGGTNGIEIWIKGNYSASLNLVGSTVEGGVYAHDEFNSNPGIVNNGTLNFTADEATTGAAAEDVTLTIARAENVNGVLEYVMDNAQAKVNDTYYLVLTDAIAAAKAGDVVTVFEGTYAMPSMKAGITIEGQGNVLFEGTLSGTLENLTMKNIHIKGGNAQRWAYAKGNLVFENVKFEATSVYALHFDGITAGTNLTYKNCTIIGWAALGGTPASCTFEGCTIEGNGTYGLIRTYFDTTIKDCTFDVANVNTNDVYQDGIHAVEGAYVTVNGCTNENGDMIDLVNIHALSIVKLGEVEIKNVVKANDNYYRTLAEAFEAVGVGNGKTVELIRDVDLASAEWTPVDFNGTFDGKGHTISNLVINGGSKSNQGFFGTTQNGEIKNVTFNNAKVSGRLNVGVVAGQPYTSKYTNVKVTGHVEVNGMAYVGGVGGKNAYANWTDITVDVDATSYVKANSVENGTAYRTYVGGVVGFNGEGGHTFKNISSNIKVIGSTCDIGGIFGIAHYNNKFENITFTGAVEAPEGAEEVGGIAGVWHNEEGTSVTFTECTSTGTVKVGEVETTGSIVGGAYNAANETSENSGSLIIDGVEAWLKVAQVGEVKYLTLAEAIKAVEDGGTVTLIDNETFTKNNYYDNDGWRDGLGYSGDKSFTIDLNEYTVSQDGSLNDYLFWLQNKGSKENTITIKNGTLDAGKTAYCALCTASSHDNKLTVNTENVTLINNNSNGSTVKIRGGSEYNANAGTKIIGKNSYLGIENWKATVNIYDGAEIYMNGTGSYNGCLAGVGGNGTINVYGGYGKGVKGGFIAMTSGGTINISGGEWIANTDGTVGDNSNLYVLTAQSNKYESGFAGPSIINVTGGTFRGGMDAWVLNNIEGEKAELNISGGNFNADPSAYVIENFSAIPKGTNLWVVKQTSGELTRTLPEGWSWFSSYVKIAGAQGLTTLESALGTSGIQIKDLAGRKFAQYSTTSGWYGDLKEASSEKMYSINTSAAVEVRLDGEFYGVIDGKFYGVEYYKPVLSTGWNFLSYPHNDTLDLATALCRFAPVEGDIIKSKSASAIYLDGSWYNAFDLVPGEGYMYRSQAGTKQVSYTTEATRAAVKSFVSETPEYWTVDATQYPGNMTMIATLDVEGGDYEVAAFVNGELRGSARPIFNNVLDQYIVIMTINGEEAANVTFKYYDFNAGEEYDFNNVAVYSDNAVLGSTEEPYALTRGTTGIGEATLSDINIYPNPTTTDREINLQATCDKVEVFNALGVKVAEYQNVDTIDALETAGTYVIRVTLNGDVKHCRLVVK